MKILGGDVPHGSSNPDPISDQTNVIFHTRCQTWGLFLDSPGNFWGPESCFVFAVPSIQDQTSIKLKIIKRSYQLTKQNLLVCGIGTVLL